MLNLLNKCFVKDIKNQGNYTFTYAHTLTAVHIFVTFKKYNVYIFIYRLNYE